MISIIKTAIITIVISFISGLLLDYYRNLAPRILCNIGKCIPIKINNKKICTYIITVRNISNKIIREVTLNIQSSQNNLKIEDAKITKGLKFNSLIKDNIFDVNIPFLSKDDEFSVTVCVENQRGVHNKPVIIIRSPENFKEVNSVEHKGLLSLLFNIPKNRNKENREIFHGNRKPNKNKKAMIIAVSAILVIIIGALAGFYLKEMPSSAQTSSAKTDVQKQSEGVTKSANGTTKNTDAKTSTDGTTKNTDAKTSTGETIGNTDAKTSTGETTENTDGKTSTGETTGNTDAKTTTGETTGTTDTKTATGETTGNTKTTTGETTGNTSTKTTTGETTGNTSTKTATGETTGNTDTKTATSGTTGTTGN